ncbi:ER membrane protein DP1/Yop1 [Lithohypha guttulata]|uniref:Protein YOP1 n=1 Tax=Lithohypha guttulata TaxID=1690604 RepID=A0AAN7TCQ1_9EURO|nr:ER membrane protein DP1/Yop1 [Lithohypha guttulata]KAK5090704.1 ER membrane protein DP1/Yop1 [Lithohypha guttulata]KAK5104497.1 ER membrane protein DP1/Yop1 [Lithohypha guttulata]
MSIQDRAQHQLGQLDKELSKYPMLNNFEQQTSIPKSWALLGLAGLYFFLVFFNIGGEFLVNFAGFIIPGYYSLDALFSASKIDDSQYWVVYAFLNVLESLVNAVYWFPFYYVFKFILVLWMALPMTNGAQVVFRSVIQPVFSRFFSTTGSTAADLRAKVDSAGKSQ